MKDYILKILIPYVKDKRIKLKHNGNQIALTNLKDSVFQTPDVIALLEQHNIDVIFVPANRTNRLQSP